MPVNFNKERWEKIRDDYSKYWDGSIRRAIIKATIHTKTECSVPVLSQSTCHDFSLTPEDIINRLDLELSNQEYLGDAFPFVNFSVFGPGVLAAFLGARLDNSSGRVWFFPQKEMELKDIRLEYDPKNKWLNRVKDIYNAGNKKWNGNVLMGMPDLGGVFDVLATFRGTDNLLMDLYDEPDEVKRISREIQELWLKIYNELNDVLKPVNPGYSDWSGLYSSEPSYIIQEDFSYMVGPEMFKEFMLNIIRKFTEEINNTVYHLDGKGELPHLDYILSLPKLKAVQWVPGDGAPPTREWVDVYKRIKSADKRVYLIGGYEDLIKVTDEVGKDGIYFSFNLPVEERDYVKMLLSRV